jgi:hypothetical protein
VATERAHGTRNRYRHGPDEYGVKGQGCRCRPCKDAAAKAMNLYRIGIATGKGRRLVDATPVREHVRQLHAQGLPLTSIAAMAPVKVVVVERLLHGQPGRGRPPSRKLLVDNARALLAVRVDSVGGDGYTLAIGTQRRLQALAWRGWPAPYVAPRIPLHPDYLKRLMRGQVGTTVTVETARRVAAVLDDLWDVDPVQAGVPAVRAGQVRTMSARKGYVSILAWDEIDDPQAKPDLGERTTRTKALLEDADELINGQGYTVENAAERLGITLTHLTTLRGRARRKQAAS